MKLIEAQRIEQRTRFDLEMMVEIGFCKGIENYSRHLSGRQPGEPPPTLIDYLPRDSLMFIDESHVTVPQVGGMYKGDRARKENLVNYGFRLPSALDNRPLRFDEFEKMLPQTIFVSATPADYEKTHAGQVVEQVVRPTGLVDPVLEVRPAQTQVDDLLSEIRLRVEKKERVLVTTLTKRMAEDLTDYLGEHGVKVRYLHSDIDTVERVEIMRDLRLGEFDVLVGINLLREGLDIPEVSLVAVLDADKEGFLRAERSLIQTIGRAARHINGMAILYADRMTDSMTAAIGETERRRNKQREHNVQMDITPKGVEKRIKDIIDGVYDIDESRKELKAAQAKAKYEAMPEKDLEKELRAIEKQMVDAARNLEFEKAAELRDRLFQLQASSCSASRCRSRPELFAPQQSATAAAMRNRLLQCNIHAGREGILGVPVRAPRECRPVLRPPRYRHGRPRRGSSILRIASDHEKTVLVFQGGGALGAYQAGVYEGFAEAGILPDWVTGVSIGAINAALIAGNTVENRLLAAARILESRVVGAAAGAAPLRRRLPARHQ